MMQFPARPINQYTSFIRQRGVRKWRHRHYVKWLRYYLDFYHKYDPNWDERCSFPAFMAELQTKKTGRKHET